MRTAAQDSAFRRIWMRLSVAGKMDPPPFGTTGQREAWRSGYEDALRDIASFFDIEDKS